MMSTLQLAVVLAGVFILLTALLVVGKVLAILFGVAIIVLAVMSAGTILRR